MTTVDTKKDINLELERLRLLEKKRELEDHLPHLYGFKHYEWSREIFESFAKNIYLSSANQIGKSALAIRKCIHWATEPKTWKKISNRQPTLFAYFYPNKVVAEREIETKWIPYFLPKGEYKNHPQYGWKYIKTDRKTSIKFNSGIEVIFLGYAQGKADLLSLAGSSIDAIFIDEECPPELIPEIQMRVEATKGCMFFLATPVICYPYYKEIFELRRTIPNSIVRTISMYECTEFEDGSPGLYTPQEIEDRKAKLGSEAEIQKRIYGRYVTPEGLVYSSFRRENNIKTPKPVPDNWVWFAGIDIGSSGVNHPAAIVFVAVAPDFKRGRVVKCWRGGRDEETPNSLILNKYIEMRAELVGDRAMFGAFYDFAAKDFELQARSSNTPGLQRANKDRTFGQGLLNTLFKNELLDIDESVENMYLVDELESLRVGENKRHSKDDLIDAVRYCAAGVPWDLTDVTAENLKKIEPKPLTERVLTQEEERRGVLYEAKVILDEMDDEIAMWNELMGE